MTGKASHRFTRGAAIFSLLATGGLAFFATTRPWWTATVMTAGMPKTEVAVTGSSVAPWAVGAALLIVAGALGVLAGSTSVRRILGVLVALVSVSAIVAVLLASSDQAQQVALDAAAVSGVSVAWELSLWRVVAIVGFIAAGLVGGLTVVRAHHWDTMSARFDAPRTHIDIDSADTWKMIDQGIDPTEEPAQ